MNSAGSNDCQPQSNAAGAAIPAVQSWSPSSITDVVHFSLAVPQFNIICEPQPLWLPSDSNAVPTLAAVSSSPLLGLPQVISLPIREKLPRINSYSFRPPVIASGLSAVPVPVPSKATAAVPARPTDMAGLQFTRLKPPADTVKLEDRLYYVLQPALETQINCGALHFPFRPFPYQFEGVSFLYPRVAAVLADEMGLG
ncbi:MAG: hypothetical protein SGJ20_20560, partial [Planctomycetota bacterium]|nr:hypothetical protein [Planctomycetota bacterium]